MWKAVKRNLIAALLGAVLLACVVAAFLTRQGSAPARRATLSLTLPIDDRLMTSARNLALQSDSAEEQETAKEALHFADHEFDQAFAIAMLEAALTPPAVSGPLLAIAARVNAIKARVAEDEKQANELAKGAAKSEEASAKLELAKAQLSLDQEELREAQADLARNGGDRRANLEQLRKVHEEGQHVPALPAVSAVVAPSTALQQVMAWMKMRDRQQLVAAAHQQALNKFGALLHERQSLSTGAAAAKEKLEEEDEAEAEAMVARLRKLSDQRKIITQLDQCAQDAQALADVYVRWDTLLEGRKRVLLHSMLLSLAWMVAVVLGVFLTEGAVRGTFRQHADRRRAHQLRVMLTIAAQIVGVLAIALIVFGPPTQISTIIGLTTAGLTVVLKDFIVAFFGWFVLMGKNGLRIGDWVEIEGVGGEVVEIGLLKTVLLEMGNWSNTGHPTGRRVSFNNKFAIEQHFFNFSTAGQWLWDELQMTLPQTSDAYRLAMLIRERVDKETEADAVLAEHDWERVTRQYETSAFSARPAVDLRPSANGLDVVVRYITRAPQRYEVKSRLFQAIVGLIHTPSVETQV